MTSFKAPPPFQPGETPALAWQQYRERYEIYSIASKLNKEDKEQQKNVFLHVIGEEGLRIFKTMKIPQPGVENPTVATMTLQHILDAFDGYYKPYRSINFSRFTFFQMKQSTNQTFAQFLTELKTLAPACELGELQDSLIATQILIGTKSETAREKLILYSTLRLEDAIAICQAEETASAQLQTMTRSAKTIQGEHKTETLDALTYHRNSRSRDSTNDNRYARRRSFSESRRHPTRQHYQPVQRARSQGYLPREQYQGYQYTKRCSQCGLSHPNRPCPAIGSRFRTCRGMNHWAATCRSVQMREEALIPTDQGWKAQDCLEEYADPNYEDEDAPFASLHLRSLTLYLTQPDKSSQVIEDTEWKAIIQVANLNITFKIDTGSQVNVIPLDLYQKMPALPRLLTPQHSIRAYSGHAVTVLGMVYLPCRSLAAKTYGLFYVTSTHATPILSGKTSVELKLIARLLTPANATSTEGPATTTHTSITRTDGKLGMDSDAKKISSLTRQERESYNPHEIIKAYSDVFDKIGKLPGKHVLRLKPSVKPTICAARRIPIQLRQAVRDELTRMEKNGVIEPVTEPTEWVHPMVVVKKENSMNDVRKPGVRICIDPRGLNPALLRSQYPMPTTQAIFANLSGSRYFTVLDAQSAFWQIQLSEDSSSLCTFATPFGRFRFKRLPYGIATASQLFQEVMHGIFGDIENVHISTDDFIIHGLNLETHNRALIAVLQRAKEKGLAFSLSKMQLAVPRIKYLGHIITREGLQIDPSKVRTITDLPPPPPDKTALQRFLGMVNYVAKFIPSYSERSAPLRELLKSTTEYQWDENVQKNYEDLKNALITAPVLQFFNHKLPCVLSVDASQHGIGAVLLQNGHPVEYASMTFNPTQIRYAQIEKELMAILYACERFHFYIAASPITIQTDHRPLLAIIKKPFHLMSPRIQRLTLRLARYDPILKFVPGSQLYVADTLSRASHPDVHYDTSYLEGPNATVYSLTTLSEEKEAKFQQETALDKTLRDVAQYCKNGWPKNRNSIQNKKVWEFWPVQEEIHEDNGLLYRGDRLIIPENQQRDIMSEIHSIHQGTTACLAKARIHVFWPNMNNDITYYVQSCQICREHDRANTATPLQPLQIPPRPWHTLGTDLFHHGGRNFIIIVDYYSKFIEAQELSTTKAQSVISAIAPHISRHGAPQKIISDNGPPFNSAIFKSFLAQWDVKHVTSSPYHPQANGLAERSIQTVKNLLVKALEDGKNIHRVLLEYNSTPKGDMQSPAEILMGRRLRTPLTTNQNTLAPHYPIHQTSQTLEERRRQMIQQASKRPHRALPPLYPGDKIYYQTGPRKWIRAEVETMDRQTDSYVIRTENGKLLRKTRTHLRLDDTRNKRTNAETRYERPQRNEKGRKLEGTKLEPRAKTRLLPAKKTHGRQQDHAEQGTVNEENSGANDMKPETNQPTTSTRNPSYAAILKSPPNINTQRIDAQRTRSGRITKKPMFFQAII